jgi:hypothetical protein
MLYGRCSLLVTALVAAISPALADNDSDISETIKRASYRSAFEQMVKGQSDLPKWMATSRALEEDATTLSGSRKVIAGEESEVFELCKAHECDDSGLIVAFSKNGEVAKGLLFDKRDVFLGQPTSEERRAFLSLKPTD